MIEFVLAHQQYLMLAQIALAFVLLGWWESTNPYIARPFGPAEARRQTTNVLLLVTNSFFLYVVGLLFLWRLSTLQFDLLFDFSALPTLWAALLGLLLLDFGSYCRHRLMHSRWLWSVHRVHHSDDHMNWTTDFRMHPLEALVGLAIKSCLVLLFGVSPLALVLFALLALAVGCWQHANIVQPAWLDKATRWWLVTPGMHRVHHLSDARMYRSNYGVIFPWWDQILGTHVKANAGRQFGLPDVDGVDVHSLAHLLVLPFRPVRRD